MRRFGPEVVDLAFKMRCFGEFSTLNSKKLCFSLLKHQLNNHEKGRWLRNPWDEARKLQETGEEQVEGPARGVGEPRSEGEVEVSGTRAVPERT